MNLRKIVTAFVILIVLTGLFSGVAAAKNEKKEQDKEYSNVKDEADQNDESCSDDSGTEDVREDVAGLSPDGKELLIKRTTVYHEKKSGDAKVKPNDVKINGKNIQPAILRCYSLMGIKWTTFPVTYTINPTNPQGLDESFITGALSQSTKSWDDATSRALFGAYTVDSSAPFGVVDGKNAMVFGNNYPTAGVIAVTYTWYYSISRRIVEFDISFETDYQWGDAAVYPTKMDVQDIATHEIGHGVGLKDLYNTCKEETMYGYASYGETKKRTLNAGDIAGIKAIYG